MIRDRGNIKWTAMMLPEHVAELRDWKGHDNYTKRPALNEWDQQAIQEEIELASKRKCEALVKTWFEGEIVEYQGIINDIDLIKMCIILEDPFGIEKIAVVDVINVQILE